MSDPRNVAHAKKVAQEKKHQGEESASTNAPAARPGKKRAAAKTPEPTPAEAAPAETPSSPPDDLPAPKPSAALESSLAVLAKLKEMEFYSRANLERLAEVTMTVEDELKQKALVEPLGEVYSAQNALQAKLTTLLEAYQAQCDRLQGGNA